MAKQASALGFGSDDAWAFGPATGNGRAKPAPRPEGEPLFDPVVESVPTSAPVREAVQPAVVAASAYSQPAVFGGHAYGQPAVFSSRPSEPSAAERHMWDQLPAERPRRGRRYVGKHRA
jgi:hypothetical protein